MLVSNRSSWFPSNKRTLLTSISFPLNMVASGRPELGRVTNPGEDSDSPVPENEEGPTLLKWLPSPRISAELK